MHCAMRSVPTILTVPDLRDRKPADNSNQDWYCAPRDYTMSIRDCGGAPLILPFAMPYITEYLHLADGIMFTGNNFPKQHTIAKNIAAKHAFEYTLISKALAMQIPLLCIAESAQLLGITQGCGQADQLHNQAQNHNSGYAEYPDDELEIIITKDSLIYNICNSFSIKTRTFCKQAITKLKPDMQATAHTSDGTIACIESTAENFCIGIQWHAELLATAYDQKLISAFVQAASQYCQQKQTQTKTVNLQLQHCL